MGPAAVPRPHLPAPTAREAAPAPAVAPPIAMGLPPGFAMPAFHGGVHPANFPPMPGSGLAPPWEAGAVPPPLASVSAPLSTPNSDDFRWLHGPASFNALHAMVVNPVDFLESLVYDQAGSPSATSILVV